MIEVHALPKRHGELQAVSDARFTARPAEILGLLGPNGAGKRTAIGCISGLLEPSAGRMCVLGHDVVLAPRLARLQLGVVPQEFAPYDELSATENLNDWESAHGLSGAALRHSVRQVLADTRLLDRASEPV